MSDVDGILLFPEPNFEGTPYHIDTPVSISQLADVKLKPDDVSSVLIGAGYKLFLYQGKYFSGEYHQYNGPATIPQLKAFDNKTNSLIVAKIGQKISHENEIALIAQGQGLVVTAPMKISNITRLGLANNGLDSVVIGKNINLKVYDLENFNGDHLELAGPYMGSLGDLDKRVSSLDVGFKKNPSPPIHDGDTWIWLLILLILVVIIIAYVLMK